eukprot:1158036-Pelagomonas_calceolata.AAC.1
MAPSCCVPKQACTRLLPKGPSVRPVLISRSWKLRAQSSGRDLPKTWNQVWAFARTCINVAGCQPCACDRSSSYSLHEGQVMAHNF